MWFFYLKLNELKFLIQMKSYLIIIFLIVCLLLGHESRADHIFGGNINLTQIEKSSGKFKITMNVYVDVAFGNTGYVTFMPTEKFTLKIFSKTSNKLMLEIPMAYDKTNELAYENEICAKLRGLRTMEFVYSKEVILSPNLYNEESGYYIAWTRCCRNNGTTNILSAGLSGITFYAEFPALIQNGKIIDYSSPTFPLPNGDYICIRKPFSMPLGATSINSNDELKYSIVTPFSSDNTLGTYSKVVEAKPYPLIKWNTGYSTNESIKGSPALSIDSKSGVINVTATQIGLFVFTIQCEQYRDGKFIGLVRQDFQMPVVDCLGPPPQPSQITEAGKPVTEVGICEGELVNLEATPAGSNFNFQWQKNGINIIGATQPKYQASQYGNYTVIKSFKTTCANDTVSQKVTLKAPILLKNNAANYEICDGDSIRIETIPTRNNLSFEWKYNNKVVGNNLYMYANKTGFYYIEGKLNGFNCSSRDSIKVNKKSSPTLKIADKNVGLSLGDSRMLEASSDNSQTTFFWSPNTWIDNPSLATPTTTPQDDIEYKVLATTPNMCPVKDSIKVTIIRRIFIPNAFTPNNDSMNDVWEISGIKQYSDNEVYIYNRWGELVYYSKGYQTAFDGKFSNGTDLPVGDYAYMIKVKKPSSDEIIEYKGALVLLR
jgi:gliding motility-associated-like protein